MVPEDEFNRLKAKESITQSKMDRAVEDQLQTEINKTNAEIEQSAQQKLSALVNVLPKKWRSRAASLIQFLIDELNSDDPEFAIDSSNQILYRNGDKGSPILDLLYYAIADQSYNRRRPLDYPDFLSLLKDLNVSESLLGDGKSLDDYDNIVSKNSVLKQWKT